MPERMYPDGMTPDPSQCRCGHAYGTHREYQNTCRSILCHSRHGHGCNSCYCEKYDGEYVLYDRRREVLN